METLVKNSTTVAALYEAFGKGDVPAILAHLHPDVQWHVMGKPTIPYGGTYNGTKDVSNFFKKLAETVNFTQFRPEYIVDADDHYVIVTGYLEVTSLKTGKVGESIWAMTWRFDEEGRVIEFHDIYDTLAAANTLS